MRIATFLQDLHGGGAERVALSLVNAMAATDEMTLVLVRAEGDYLGLVDPRVRVITLGGGTTLKAITKLARWLRRDRPDVLISHLTHVNVAAALGARLSRMGIPHVAVEHNQMGLNFARISRRSVRVAYRAVRYVYPGIDAVVSVSHGVQDAVRTFARLPGRNLQVIANPVVTSELRRRMAEAPTHPWLGDGGPPVVLGCGRLVEQKDFPNLLRAFEKLRQRCDARLLILGEGEDRPKLEAMAASLGIADAVALPGFDANPYAAMRAATLFALSSRWEGLPTVLIEALATGTNVVSTDCPSGPREVLDGGRFGRLVPVNDANALATAMEEALARPIAPEILRARADLYSDEVAVAAYRALFTRLAGRG